MSMTLILWKTPVVDDPEEAQALLETWYETGDDSAFEHAAWQIPIGWLRWPAVIVAGFLAAAGQFVFFLMIAGALGFIDANERAEPCQDDAPLL